MNSTDITQITTPPAVPICDGMWLYLKGSDDCFDTSLYTISQLEADLAPIFTFAAAHAEKYPILNSFDWLGHAFVPNGLENQLLEELTQIASVNSTLRELARLTVKYIQNATRDDTDSHRYLQFNGV